jgi:hypothetical protein
VNITPLSPDEFAHAWGEDALVRLSADAAMTLQVPDHSRNFLARAGLPVLLHYFLGSTDAKISFLRLDAGVTPVSEEKTVGPPLPRSWSSYQVLGDEFFCNGSAWWCVHEPSGNVCRVDIELDEPVELANTSVEHFASALLAAWKWSHRYSGRMISELDRLRDELRALDPHAMAEPRSFWPSWLNFIDAEKETLVDVGVRVAEWRKGTREDGDQAIREGAW